jgi:hypothetical protein
LKKKRLFLIAILILTFAALVFSARWWAPGLFKLNHEKEHEIAILTGELALLIGTALPDSRPLHCPKAAAPACLPERCYTFPAVSSPLQAALLRSQDMSG